MTDIFEKASNSAQAHDIAQLRALKGYPFFYENTPDLSLKPYEVRCNGRVLVSFGSNDYLGLTRDTRIIAAALEATKHYGTGCSGSRLLNGTTSLHLQLEQNLAEFFHKPAALLFSTGFQANLGVVSAVAGAGDAIIADEYCHASIVDGMRLSYAQRRRFRHNDISSLREALSSCPAKMGRLIAVEGLYSMGGDLCPLSEVCELCAESGARLFVDDAHGIGTLGTFGQGAAEVAGVLDKVDLLVGTFSKSFAGIGGFVVGAQDVLDYVRHVSSAFVFSASLPPAVVAGALAALRIIQNEPERRTRLLESAGLCRQLLRARGFDVESYATPIILVSLGKGENIRHAAAEVGLFCNALTAEGFYVNAALGSAVSFPGLRISVTAAHDQTQIHALMDAMCRARDQAKTRLAACREIVDAA
ncbi:MAG: aminotransferase class I/II-fold pyridoxal phosphate-dependent enzyme [Deltaproteobacteria bacterium]|nr:aminotransferase class I/II-fold pyridoxal phosphate-dependent enzyme [Deltaproteobacteria bacterium]